MYRKWHVFTIPAPLGGHSFTLNPYNIKHLCKFKNQKWLTFIMIALAQKDIDKNKRHKFLI